MENEGGANMSTNLIENVPIYFRGWLIDCLTFVDIFRGSVRNLYSVL
jgi:hypothetical protein